jgi:Malectin domain
MKQIMKTFPKAFALFFFAMALLILAGCQSGHNQSNTNTSDNKPALAASEPVQTLAATAAAPASNPPAAPVPPPVRIKAGASNSLKDADGNTWLADRGFTDGETTERPDVQITNTKTPALYQSERYSMAAFSYPVPNGKYIVKLHFCETYEGITGPGQRIFSFNVEGHEFKDFDLWVKAGGFLRAYIETVEVEVTDGKLDVSFTPNVENPQINGIEILPAS